MRISYCTVRIKKLESHHCWRRTIGAQRENWCTIAVKKCVASKLLPPDLLRGNVQAEGMVAARIRAEAFLVDFIFNFDEAKLTTPWTNKTRWIDCQGDRNWSMMNGILEWRCFGISFIQFELFDWLLMARGHSASLIDAFECDKSQKSIELMLRESDHLINIIRFGRTILFSFGLELRSVR